MSAVAGSAPLRIQGATESIAFKAARDPEAELGISRSTLYRWCGGRDRLLSDVVWSLSHQLFEQAKADHPADKGTDRVLAVFRQHVTGIIQARPLQILLQQETYAALRLLTSECGQVQARTVRDLADLLREEQDAGALELRGCRQPRLRDRPDDRGLHLPRHGGRGRA